MKKPLYDELAIYVIADKNLESRWDVLNWWVQRFQSAGLRDLEKINRLAKEGLITY